MNSDPIADLLTRIRNANRARKDWTDVPWSKLKEAIARVLVDEGFLREVAVNEGDGRKLLRVSLVRAARKEKVGGEVLCSVW
jgi:small subunit ribosomal protein S8